VKKDYDKLARAVPCAYCGARSGQKCFGARGTAIQSTHHVRRALAAFQRGEQVRRALAAATRQRKATL